jgi:hypothetical protein
MKILSYSFLPGGLIRIVHPDNQVRLIRQDQYSGKVIRRKKVGTISEVQHTGIWLGKDAYAEDVLILHNHYQIGFAHITTYQEYALGQTVYWYEERCTNNPSQVLSIALRDAQAGIRYNALFYNCQTFTNRACRNQNHSQDATKWVGIAFSAVVCIGIARALAS